MDRVADKARPVEGETNILLTPVSEGVRESYGERDVTSAFFGAARRTPPRLFFYVFVALLAQNSAAFAKSCYPEKAPANLLGKYFVHEHPSPDGRSQIRTSVIAGRSPEGGLISCFYAGRPGALGALQTILATDQNYSFAWSLDPQTGNRQVSNAEERACDLGSLGPCTARRPGGAPGRPTLVQEWDRRCEGGSWVKIRLSLRYEGGDPALRALWNDQVKRYPKRRSEIRYRDDGAILSTVTQVGLRRTAPSRLIEEGDWKGPNCLPNETS